MSTQDISDQRRAYSIDDFCRLYGYGKSTTYRAIAGGRLRARKAGSRTIILAGDIAAWEASLPAVEPKADRVLA